MADLTHDKANTNSSATNLAVCCSLLAAVVVPASIVVAVLYERSISAQLLIDVAIGGGVCWLAASLGLASTLIGNRLHSPVQGMLIGMIFRMGLPLATLIVLPRMGGGLDWRGVTANILGIYLVALVAETLLALRMVPSLAPTVKAT
jgi:hypothetical protein